MEQYTTSLAIESGFESYDYTIGSSLGYHFGYQIKVRCGACEFSQKYFHSPNEAIDAVERYSMHNWPCVVKVVKSTNISL